MRNLPDFVSAAVSDIGSLFGAPGTALAGAAIARYLRKKDEEARDILLEELRAARVGEAAVASEDDLIGVLFRYLRAVREGTARLNLRLLAKVIVGQYSRGSLVADEFLEYASILCDLSREEIVAIGTMYKHWHAAQQPRTVGTARGDPWLTAKDELIAGGMAPDDITATVTRAQRSGLVMAVSAYSALAFQTTPLLQRLGALVDFQDTLRREQRAAAAGGTAADRDGLGCGG